MDKPTFPMVVEGFTASVSYDVYRNGEKVSSFVSMTFRFPTPLSPEQAVLAEVEGSDFVTRAAILNALARGSISSETAKEMIDSHKVRNDGIKTVIQRKLQGLPPDPEPGDGER